MLTPIVTEIRRDLEPAGRDTFIGAREPGSCASSPASCAIARRAALPARAA